MGKKPLAGGREKELQDYWAQWDTSSFIDCSLNWIAISIWERSHRKKRISFFFFLVKEKDKFRLDNRYQPICQIGVKYRLFL